MKEYFKSNATNLFAETTTDTGSSMMLLDKVFSYKPLYFNMVATTGYAFLPVMNKSRPTSLTKKIALAEATHLFCSNNDDISVRNMFFIGPIHTDGLIEVLFIFCVNSCADKGLSLIFLSLVLKCITHSLTVIKPTVWYKYLASISECQFFFFTWSSSIIHLSFR